MTCSLDLRRRALAFIENGGSQVEASRVFGVTTRTLYNWLQRKEDLAPKVHGQRVRKLDKEALQAHVRDYPDALLRERAQHFGVHINAVWVALKQLQIVKKTTEIC